MCDRERDRRTPLPSSGVTSTIKRSSIFLIPPSTPCGRVHSFCMLKFEYVKMLFARESHAPVDRRNTQANADSRG